MDTTQHIVQAHEQKESEEFVEILPSHIDRKEASQRDFDHAKKFLTDLYKGKRCFVCEMRGEKPQGQIESHHVFEWAHSNDLTNRMKQVEIVLRLLSPFIHGRYMMTDEEILSGKLYSLWEHPDLKDRPFDNLDDPRNQLFLCHAHHQQSTKEQIEEGYDVIGLHHEPFPQWILNLVLPNGKFPTKHIIHKNEQV